MTEPQPNPHPQANTLQTALSTRHLPPTKDWLSTFLTSQSTTSSAALLSTATFRLLNSNITQTLSSSSSLSSTSSSSSSSGPTTYLLPPDISAPDIPSRNLGGAEITVQILDVVDIGVSAAVQLDALEMWARGEMRAGRGIVRVVTAEDGDGDGDGDGFAPATGTGAGAGSVYKFLLQDSRGRLVWGVDCDAVFSVAGLIGTAAGAGVANQVTIGTKILLRNGCRVDRGVVRIEGAFVTVLGGRIEGLEKIWREGRIERLKLLLAGEE